MIESVDIKLLEALAASAPAPKATAKRNGRASANTFDIDQWIARHGIAVEGPEPWKDGRRWVFPVCPWNSDHTNRSAFIIEQASRAICAGCQHNGCQGKGWHHLRDVVEPDWRGQRNVPGENGQGTKHDQKDQVTRGADDQHEPDQDRFTINRITSREFDAGDYSTVWLVDDLMAERQPMVIAAQLKTMKTTIAVALGISLAMGRAFLGKFWVSEACNVLLLSGESGLATLQSAGRRIAASHGYELGDVGRLFWSTDLPRLGFEEHLQALREAILRDEIAVLIADPLYFMLPGEDAGNLMIIGGYLRTLSKLCEEMGVTLVLVHHVRKTGIDNKHDPPELSQISWSGTAEWARQWLLLSRRENYVPGTGEHRLWMVTGGSAGHSGLHALDIREGVGEARAWEVDVLSADEVRNATEDAKENAQKAKQKTQIERDKRSILDVVVKLPEHQGTKTEIRERVARNGQAFNAAFAELVNDGVLLPSKITKDSGRSYDGFKLKNDSQ